MGGQGGLHLARLDPVAAHLDLVIGPAEELQLPVGPPPGPVPRPVQPRPVGRERVGDEPLGGQGGTAAVAARDARRRR